MDVEIKNQHLTMIGMAMDVGNIDRAVSIVYRAFAEDKERSQTKVTETTHVADLLNPKIATILESAGVEYVGDLIALTRTQIVALAQLRWKSVGIIEQTLAKHGFDLKKTSVDGAR